MISRLRGVLVLKQAPLLLIEAGPLTYEVQASMQTFDRLPELNQEILLFTHFVVREDGHYLYGFSEHLERTLFRELIKITGIGPKLALVILSSIRTEILIDYVTQQNSQALERLPGIGKKTAQRLIVEMRDRLAQLTELTHASVSQVDTVHSDAVSALIALGYTPAQARRAVEAVRQPNHTVEVLIRLALSQAQGVT